MSLGLVQIYTLLELEEETVVLELLDINSEELVKAFKGKIRERKPYLTKYYEDQNEQEEERPLRKHSEYSGLGSKEVWEAAGFDMEKSDYQ